MAYYLIAAVLLIVFGTCIYYCQKRKKPIKYIRFRKRISRKKVSAVKYRRHALLDRDRGKVIPFPLNAVSSNNGGCSDPSETGN